jgi:hypothetical protein
VQCDLYCGKLNKLSMVAHVCNSITWEAEAEGLRVQGQLGLYNDFKVFSAM